MNTCEFRAGREGLWSKTEFDRPKVDPERKIVADIQKCSAWPRRREHRDRPSSHSLLFIFPRQGRRPESRRLRGKLTVGAFFLAPKGHCKRGWDLDIEILFANNKVLWNFNRRSASFFWHCLELYFLFPSFFVQCKNCQEVIIIYAFFQDTEYISNAADCNKKCRAKITNTV